MVTRPSEWEGRTHKYLPDFLVRVETGAGELTLVLEVKGHEREQDGRSTPRPRSGSAR